MTEKTDKTAERVSRMIRGLQAKTVENGCTEEEAMIAATKVRELMDEYRLTMSDVEIQAETVGTDDIVTRFKGLRPVDYCTAGIARYCGVKMWRVTGRGTNMRVRILGLKSDSEMAAWLYQMIEGAIVSETAAWQKDPATGWKLMDGQTKKTSCKSFEVGMASRIGQRLREMAKALEPTALTATGTALVVVKNQLVEDAFTKLGLVWGRGSSGIAVKSASHYEAGKAAGDRVNLSRPLGNSATKRIGA